MAENELDGFDDLDNLFGEEGGGGGGADDPFGGAMDNLMAESAPASAPAAAAAPKGGGDDSELDSFFEDLSTIDDLEVIEEMPPPQAAAAPVEKAAPAPKAEKPKKEKPKKEKKEKVKKVKTPRPPREMGDFTRQLMSAAMALLVIGGLMSVVMFYLFPKDSVAFRVRQKDMADMSGGLFAFNLTGIEDMPLPDVSEWTAWVQEKISGKEGPPTKPRKPSKHGPDSYMEYPEDEEEELTAGEKRPGGKIPLAHDPLRAEPPPPPRIVPEPPKRHIVQGERPPKAAPRLTPPPAYRGKGGYSVQVASCFFEDCVDAFRQQLKQAGLTSHVAAKKAKSNTVELYSQTRFASREQAQDLADRINEEFKVEGQAFVVQGREEFSVSLGDYPNLVRANEVKERLNQVFAGETRFTVRLKPLPYQVTFVKAGPYRTRKHAEMARTILRGVDQAEFKDAFVVRN
ncbi:MAG: SPOR domain-containing protein [Deltaproteobacteria bacterium]|nr:SPOR domain-containing protein [Deltaproteobacteria bacterium]